MIVGNLGDSRAVLCTRDRDQLIPVQLTVDLKPDIPSKYWYINIDISSQVLYKPIKSNCNFINVFQVKLQESLAVKEGFSLQTKNRMYTEYGCLMMTVLD